MSQSRAAGCRYCMAHTAGGALHFGVEDKKLAAVWEYQTSPLYSAAERATLDFAIAAASVPNAVTDEMFAELRQHWSEEQIIEIVGVIALFGFPTAERHHGHATRGMSRLKSARNISRAAAGGSESTTADRRSETPYLAFIQLVSIKLWLRINEPAA